MGDIQNFKTQHAFFNKRERIIKGGWRHGVTGVEDPEAANPSFLYAEIASNRK